MRDRVFRDSPSWLEERHPRFAGRGNTVAGTGLTPQAVAPISVFPRKNSLLHQVVIDCLLMSQSVAFCRCWSGHIVADCVRKILIRYASRLAKNVAHRPARVCGFLLL